MLWMVGWMGRKCQDRVGSKGASGCSVGVRVSVGVGKRNVK